MIKQKSLIIEVNIENDMVIVIFEGAIWRWMEPVVVDFLEGGHSEFFFDFQKNIVSNFHFLGVHISKDFFFFQIRN